MAYKITCKDCIHFYYATTVVDEIQTNFGKQPVVIRDTTKPPYCDYIKGTTSPNHPACTLGGFKLKVD